MAWLYLTCAIVLEIAGTISMKLSVGFERLLPSVLVFVFYGFSFTFMIVALKRIELSVAYAVWSGAGTAIVAVIGILLFREPATMLKLASLALVVLGVIGLRVSTS